MSDVKHQDENSAYDCKLTTRLNSIRRKPKALEAKRSVDVAYHQFKLALKAPRQDKLFQLTFQNYTASTGA